MYKFECVYTHIYITREIPACGGISLALRGSGAFGATFGVPAAPIWETAAFGGGESLKNKKLGRLGRPGRGVSLRLLRRRKKKFRRLRRPKWF